MTMQLAERKKLIGSIAEIEASRDRAKGETRYQSEVFKNAKSEGFDNKAMRKVLQRRAMTDADRAKMDEAVDDYEHALGALASAKEAVAGGMSAREAADRYNVPRGALGVVVSGAKNAIYEPAHDADGVIEETAELESPPGEGSVRADNEAASGASLANPIQPGNQAHEGEENGQKLLGCAADAGKIARGGGGSSRHGDGSAGRAARGQPAPSERHAGSDRGAAGAVCAAATVDQRQHGAAGTGAPAGDAFLHALPGECDGLAPQSAGRDLREAGRAAVEIREEAHSWRLAGSRSEPSIPAEQSVNSAPPLGRVSPRHHDGEGTQSGTNSTCGSEGSAPIFSVTGSSGTSPKSEREPDPQDPVCVIPDSPDPCPNTCAREGRCAWDDVGPLPDHLRRVRPAA